MSGLELVPYELDNAAPCPLCGFAHNRFTGIYRAGETIMHHPRISETVPARILGWALECGCLLPSAVWEWVAAAGVPMRWVRKSPANAEPWQVEAWKHFEPFREELRRLERDGIAGDETKRA